MKNFKEISETLALFNNVTLSKACWMIILKSLELPTGSIRFWKSFRTSLVIHGRKYATYTLIDMCESTFRKIWNNYCEENRESVKKVRDKKKKTNPWKIKKPYYVNPDGTVTFVDNFYNKEYNW